MSSLFIGIDVGKASHMAALLSVDLLAKNKKYDKCPVQRVENSRTGFTALLNTLRKYADPTDCHVLLEHTGHYGMALEQFLQESGVQVYRMMARKRYGANKTDTNDARALAALLYNQVELHVQVINEPDRVHPLVPACDASRSLRGLVRHRHELAQEQTQRRNKLTSICDELFPELTTVYKDPNKDSALNLREKYPSPQLVAEALIDDLCATRKRTLPSREQLLELQRLARHSIGVKDAHRQDGLILEQDLLIKELRLINQHIATLDEKIEVIISSSRDGQILASFIGVGSTQAAILLAGIGSIANFESIAKLRGYMGWSPRQSQTGTTYDSTSLDRSGNVLLKQTMFMVVMTAVKYDPHWKSLYERLTKEKCSFDARTGKYKGKMKVIGRLAGQIIGVMYTLLRKDFDLISALPPGNVLPAPELYSVVESKRE